MHRNQELRRLTLPAAVGAALVVISSAAYAQDAKITSVTLYPGSATVERTARVTPGMTRLEIFGLPANFDPQTLRVDADPGVRVGEVSAQDTARTTAPNAREAQLEEKIQALKDHQAALDAEVKSAEMVNAFLARLGTQGNEKAPMPDAKSLASIVDLIRKGGGDSLTRIRRAQAQKREIAKQIAALERDLARLKSGTKDTRTVIVGVFAERPGYARVSYQRTSIRKLRSSSSCARRPCRRPRARTGRASSSSSRPASRGSRRKGPTRVPGSCRSLSPGPTRARFPER